MYITEVGNETFAIGELEPLSDGDNRQRYLCLVMMAIRLRLGTGSRKVLGSNVLDEIEK